jgi:hypothetical protein
MAIRARPVVVLQEPSAQNPTRLVLQGVIAIAPQNGTLIYGTPACGYIHYDCPAGSESACKAEWADIAAAADRGECVVFGGWFGPTMPPRLRPLGEAVASPDHYTTNLGVATVPCKPVPASAERPDLTIACAVPGAPDAGPQGRADAAAPAGGAGGGTGGSGGSSSGGAGDAGAGGSGAGTPPGGKKSGCSFGGPVEGPGLVVVVSVLGASWRRRKSGKGG